MAVSYVKLRRLVNSAPPELLAAKYLYEYGMTELLFKHSAIRQDLVEDVGEAKVVKIENYLRDLWKGGLLIMYWSSGCGRIELEMTLAQARSASHSGSCDADVLALSKAPKIKRQLDKIDPELFRGELKEYGCWEDDELASHEDNIQRILWIAAGHIADDNAGRKDRD